MGLLFVTHHYVVPLGAGPQYRSTDDPVFAGHYKRGTGPIADSTPLGMTPGFTSNVGSSGAVKIIFDTDMDSDCDDAGAPAMLHGLADNGDVDMRKDFGAQNSIGCLPDW